VVEGTGQDGTVARGRLATSRPAGGWSRCRGGGQLDQQAEGQLEHAVDARPARPAFVWVRPHTSGRTTTDTGDRTRISAARPGESRSIATIGHTADNGTEDEPCNCGDDGED
jgi:hypothetical protein